MIQTRENLDWKYAGIRLIFNFKILKYFTIVSRYSNARFWEYPGYVNNDPGSGLKHFILEINPIFPHNPYANTRKFNGPNL